jgi:hypothetical protein
MKKLLIVVFSLIGFASISNAQCDKNVVLTSSKTDYTDSTGKVERSRDENTNIDITKDQIKILAGDDEMSGKIKSKTCDWKVPFKDGKMVLVSDLTSKNGEVHEATLTIQGKDGVKTLVAEVKEFPNMRIKMNIEKFEEKK